MTKWILMVYALWVHVEFNCSVIKYTLIGVTEFIKSFTQIQES